MASGRKPKGKHPDKKLSPAFVHKTTKPGRYCDGNGLYLKVDPSGARRWEQRLVIQGRQRTLGLGGVQLVSLSEAREKALANRKIARAGGDPMDLRRQANIPTFEAAAAAVIELHRPSWRNAKHASQWETTLRTYVYPRLANDRCRISIRQKSSTCSWRSGIPRRKPRGVCANASRPS